MRKNIFHLSLMALLPVLMMANTCFAQQNITTDAQSSQGQTQGQSLTVITPDSGGGTSSATASDIPRPFAYPMITPGAPQHPGYWGVITPDGRFQKVTDIVRYTPDWPWSMATALAERKGGKVDVSMSSFRTYPRAFYITVVCQAPHDGKELAKFNTQYEEICDINVYGLKGADSKKVLGTAIIKSMELGVELLLPTNEGAALELISKSFYAGLGASPSMVSGGQAGAGAGSGFVLGFAWGKGNAYYATKPWASFKGFRKKAGYTGYNTGHTREARPTPKSPPKPAPIQGIEENDKYGAEKPKRELIPPAVTPMR